MVLCICYFGFSLWHLSLESFTPLTFAHLSPEVGHNWIFVKCSIYFSHWNLSQPLVCTTFKKYFRYWQIVTQIITYILTLVTWIIFTCIFKFCYIDTCYCLFDTFHISGDIVVYLLHWHLSVIHFGICHSHHFHHWFLATCHLKWDLFVTWYLSMYFSHFHLSLPLVTFKNYFHYWQIVAS